MTPSEHPQPTAWLPASLVVALPLLLAVLLMFCGDSWTAATLLFLAGAEQLETLVGHGSWWLPILVWLVALVVVAGLWLRGREGSRTRGVLAALLVLAGLALNSPFWLLHKSAALGLVVAIATAGILTASRPSGKLAADKGGATSLSVIVLGVHLSVILGSVSSLFALSWTLPGLLPAPVRVREVFLAGNMEGSSLLPVAGGVLCLVAILLPFRFTSLAPRLLLTPPLFGLGLGVLSAFGLAQIFGESLAGLNQIVGMLGGSIAAMWLWRIVGVRSVPQSLLCIAAIFYVVFPLGLGLDQLWDCSRIAGQPGVTQLSARPDGFDLASDADQQTLLVSHRDQRMVALHSTQSSGAGAIAEMSASSLPSSLTGLGSDFVAMIAPENVLALGDSSYLVYAFVYLSSTQWSSQNPFHESAEALLGPPSGVPGPRGVVLLRISGEDGEILATDVWAGCWPAGVAIHRGAGLVITTCEEESELWVSRAESPAEPWRVELPKDLRLERLVTGGTAADPIAWGVSLWEGEELVEVGLQTGRVRANIPVGGFNWDLAASDRSRQVFVPRFVSGKVAVWSPDSGERTESLKLDFGMRPVEYDDERGVLYGASTYSGRLAAWSQSSDGTRLRAGPPLRMGTMLRALHLCEGGLDLYAASDCGVFRIAPGSLGVDLSMGSGP